MAVLHIDTEFNAQELTDGVQKIKESATEAVRTVEAAYSRVADDIGNAGKKAYDSLSKQIDKIQHQITDSSNRFEEYREKVEKANDAVSDQVELLEQTKAKLYDLKQQNNEINIKIREAKTDPNGGQLITDLSEQRRLNDQEIAKLNELLKEQEDDLKQLEGQYERTSEKANAGMRTEAEQLERLKEILDDKLAQQEKIVEGAEKEAEAASKSADAKAKSTDEDEKAVKSQERVNKTVAKGTDNLNAYKQILDALPPNLRAVVVSLEGFIGTIRKFMTLGWGAVITAIVVAIKSLTSYFTHTAEGADRFASIMGYLKGVVATLEKAFVSLGKWIYDTFSNPMAIVDSLRDKITSAFRDPKEFVKDLWETIKEFFVNRMIGVVNQWAALKDIIASFLDLNWDGVTEGVKNFGKATLQSLGLSGVAKEIRDFTNEMDEAGKKMADIEKRRSQLKSDKSAFQVTQARLDEQISNEREQMVDGNLADRFDHASKALDLINQKYKGLLGLQARELALLKEQKAIDPTIHQSDINEAQAAYEQLKSQYNSALKQQEQQIYRIEMQQAKLGLKLSEREAETMRATQRAAFDARMEVENSIVEAMKDGAEKRERQMHLSHEREMEMLRRQKEDVEKEARKKIQSEFESNPNNSNKVWDDSWLTDESLYEIADDDMRALIDRYKDLVVLMKDEIDREVASKNRDFMVEYLKEYGTLEQQRLAISQEYDRKIADAKYEWQVRMLQKEKDEVLKQTAATSMLNDIRKNPSFIDAMISPSGVTTESLKRLNEQLDKAREELSNLPPDQLRSITDLIHSINEELISRDPFQTLKESLNELDKAETERKKAAEDYSNAQTEVGNLKAAAVPYELIALAEERAEEAKNRYINACNKEKQAEDKVAKSRTKIVSDLNTLASELNNVAAAAAGFGGETSKYITAIGSLVNVVGSSISMVSALSSDSISTIEKASVILAVISQAIQFASYAADLLGLSKDDSDYEAAKSRYDELSSIWDELIDKKMEYLSISWGTEIQQAGNEARSMAQNAIYAAREMAMERLNAGASVGSHSYGARMDDDLKQYFRRVGISSVNELVSMSGERLEKIKEQNAVFWAKLDDDFRSYLEDIIDGYDRIDDLNEAIKEKYTQITFDEMYDSFVDTLMDMDSSAADFADNVSEYFMRAVLSNQVGEKYKKQLNEWYDELAKDLEVNGGTLTPSEIEILNSKYKSIVEDAIVMRDSIASIVGYSGDFEQNASAGGFKGFSQESVDELNGRFAALHLEMMLGVEQLEILTSESATCSKILDDILTQSAIANTYLESLAADITSIRTDVSSKLGNIVSNTDNI